MPKPMLRPLGLLFSSFFFRPALKSWLSFACSRDWSLAMQVAMSRTGLKIAFLGPKSGGKTRLANHLAGQAAPEGLPYDPTVGVRILNFVHEYKVGLLLLSCVLVSDRVRSSPCTCRSPPISRSSLLPRPFRLQSSKPVEVELWDCSGDQQYEACWPAILTDLAGIVVVYDASSQAQASESRVWCEWFTTKAGLKTGTVAIFGVADDVATPVPGLSICGNTVSVPGSAVSTTKGADDGPSPAQAAFAGFVAGLGAK